MSEYDAGRELDALVAEQIMGWRAGDDRFGVDLLVPPDDDSVLRLVPLYSTDIDAALAVVEKMRADGFGFGLMAEIGEPWLAEFWNPVINSFADTAPLAICRAALAALGYPSARAPQGEKTP